MGTKINSKSQSCLQFFHTLGNDNLQTVTPCPGNKNRQQFIDLLGHWDQFAERCVVKYVIAMGSLLGQYRNKDVIPGDEDVGVLVDATCYKVLKTFSQKRNFEQGGDDEFHLVAYPQFDTKAEDDRQRWNCQDKVNL